MYLSSRHACYSSDLSNMRASCTDCTTGVWEINTHLDVAGVFCPDPAPLISKLTPRYPTAANKDECLYITDRLHSPCACP